MLCKICHNPAFPAFNTLILDRFDETLYKCPHCGFLSVDNAHWLNLAYEKAINESDTGIVSRNLYLYKIVTCMATLIFGFGKKAMGGGYNENNEYTLIDFGGGTGLLVRLLRDVGIESLWSDEYCENLFARGFEYNERKKYNLALGTSFEVFEHLPNPKESIDAMLRICPNLLFSTELLPLDIPIFSGKNKWWYYGFEHGQHISFYTQKSLEIIAKSHNLYFISYGNIHCMSEQKINPFLFAWIIRLSHKGLFSLAKRKLKSKTINDSQILSGERL